MLIDDIVKDLKAKGIEVDKYKYDTKYDTNKLAKSSRLRKRKRKKKVNV